MSGFDLGGAINGAADWACSAPIIRTIVSNPVFTALLITALVVIVAMSLYGRQIKSSGGKVAARASLYVFLLVSAVMFVHHYAVVRSTQDSAHQKGVRDVFSSIHQSRGVSLPDTVPVIPGSSYAAQSYAQPSYAPQSYAPQSYAPNGVSTSFGTNSQILENSAQPATYGGAYEGAYGGAYEGAYEGEAFGSAAAPADTTLTIEDVIIPAAAPFAPK